MNKVSIAQFDKLEDRAPTYALVGENAAAQLKNFFDASVGLMKVMARDCGHDLLSKFNADDLTTWHREMADLSGVAYGGVAGPTATQEMS